MVPSQLFTPPSTPISSPGNQGTSQLAEFASTMVYLMWHARKNTTKMNALVSERSWSPSLMNGNDLAYLMWQSRKPTSKTGSYSPFGGSNDHSFSYTASPAFKKFCYQVLTTTQLQESAVYLSLKYIVMLLQSNPSIEGAEGSEYRLFIVALMLANKFLDDNTFTNKTWSDVSGMKVHDLNIMEAEFLEALDYNLFVREHEYCIWKQLLEECRDRAQQMSYYESNPQQRQQLVLLTLKTLGLYKSNDTFEAARLQHLENSHRNYQHFLNQKASPFAMQSQQAYNNCYYYNDNNNHTSTFGYNIPITNLSQPSWDPFSYSLNRCQDLPAYSASNSYYNNYSTTPISFRNYI